MVFDVVYDAGFACPADTIISVGTNGNLTAGSYCIVIKDANGCDAATECFVINEPIKLSLDATLTNISCEILTGNIDLAIQGGTMPYTIDWDDINNPNDPEDRDNLSSGEYSVTVTDANGCTASLNALPIVDNCPACEETPIVINNLTIKDADCGDRNGSALIDVQGMESDYIFTWFPNVSNNEEAFNLQAGPYSVTITHRSNGDCVTPEPINFVIRNEDIMNGEVVSIVPATCAAADGNVTLSPDDLIYEWSDGGLGAVRNDLMEGDYTITAVSYTHLTLPTKA